MMTGPRLRISLAAATAALLAASPMAAAPAASSAPAKILGYSAQITRASYGVPHITAANFASLGFGAGYAQAEDNVCVIAEKVITVDAIRSRYFGATGPGDPNVRSDLFFQKVKDDRVVERLLAGPPDGVHAPSLEARDLLRGF